MVSLVTFVASTRPLIHASALRSALGFTLAALLLLLNSTDIFNAESHRSVLTSSTVDFSTTYDNLMMNQRRVQLAERKAQSLMVTLLIFLVIFLISCSPAGFILYTLLKEKSARPSWAQPSSLSPRNTPGYVLKSAAPTPVTTMRPSSHMVAGATSPTRSISNMSPRTMPSNGYLKQDPGGMARR